MTRDSIIVDGKPRLLRGATLQWFRLPEEVWADRLDELKAGGWNTVDMYVPWSDIEPVEGQFDAAALAKMVRFLEACQERGLFVYLRPGPYICNEQTFGGMAPWLIKRATKRKAPNLNDVNIRTSDPNWLELCQKYLSVVNQAVRPFLGNTVVLYAIENENNWFELARELEKFTRVDGRSERSMTELRDTTKYLEALRQMVLADGINVPITTCPGIPALVGMGKVEGVIPMPNDYMPGKSEWKAYRLRSQMHGKAAKIHGGHPTGITESPPDPLIMSRFFMGGMDAFMGFNTAGMHQDGLRNAVLPDPKALIEKGVVRALREFDIGYFTGVFDVGGPISSTGGRRESFYEFHLVNSFFETFEQTIAPLGSPCRTGSVGPFGGKSDGRVTIHDGRIGAAERFGRVRYFFDAGQGQYFISLLNERDRPAELDLGTLQVDGARYPRYEKLSIPAKTNPIMVVGRPLTPGARLQYSTAEIFTERAFNGGRLLVVHGPEDARGELALDRLSGAPTILHADPGIEVREQTEGTLVLSFPYDQDRVLSLRTQEGEPIHLLVTSRARAARTWFVKDGERDVALTGLDYVLPKPEAGSGAFEYEHATAEVAVTALSSGPVKLPGFEETRAWSPERPATGLRLRAPIVPPAVPEGLFAGGARAPLAAEAQPDFDDSGWVAFCGNPQAVENFDVFEGHAWYRAELDLTPDALESLKASERLRIGGASDFVGIYVNGRYVTTVAPHGTEIDSAHPKDERYRFTGIAEHLKPGRNVLAFKTEIWGHASFPLPGGAFPITGARAPSVSLTSMRGLMGEARLGDLPIQNWKVRPGLVPAGQEVPARAEAGLPSVLQPGEVVVYETGFDRSEWPEAPSVRAPLAIGFSGESAKATVYLNPPRTADGELDLASAASTVIGRWLSDEAWINRGTWAHALRDMWSVASPDCFPIPGERLREGRNDLVIVFEDASDNQGPAGRIDRVALVRTEDPATGRGVSSVHHT